MGRGKEQSQGTPAWLLDRVYRVLGRPLRLDPCDDVSRRVCALRHVALPENGLSFAWTKTTFFNPPFETLGDWIEKASRTRSPAGIIGLFPLRPHRRYWHWIWRSQRICILEKPVVYEGHEHGSPFACVVTYWGPDPERFDRAFRDTGALIDPLTICNRMSILPTMETQQETQDTLKAQYEAFMQNEHRERVLQAFRALPGTTCFEDIEFMPEGDLEVIMKTPFSELFPTSTPTNGTHKATNGTRKAKTNGTRKAKPQKAKPQKAKTKKKAPPASVANDGAPDFKSYILAEVKRSGEDGTVLSALQELYPSKSAAQIRHALQKLLEGEEIYKEGVARGTRYYAYT